MTIKNKNKSRSQKELPFKPVLQDVLDFWIEEFDKFAKVYEETRKSNKNFEFVVAALSSKCPLNEFDNADNAMLFNIPYLNNISMDIIVKKDRFGYANLTKRVKCHFHSGKTGVVEEYVTQLSKYWCKEAIKLQFLKYLDNRVFHLYACDFNEDSEYRKLNIGVFDRYNDALNEAKALAREYSVSKPLCVLFEITSCIIDKKTPPPFFTDEKRQYTLSSKTEGETQRTLRLDCSFGLEIDSYTNIIPKTKSLKMSNPTIVVMTIITIDENGNSSFDLTRYDSIKDARQTAESILDEWMDKNRYTFDENKCKSGLYTLCTKNDDYNLIEVHNIKNIAEFNALIKEFEI